QIRSAVGAVRLAAAREQIRRTSARFPNGADRTSVTVRQFLEVVVGKSTVDTQKVWSLWETALQRLRYIKGRTADFDAIDAITREISAAGAPQWAKRKRLSLQPWSATFMTARTRPSDVPLRAFELSPTRTANRFAWCRVPST